jgi:hypothetical protein
MSMREDFLFLKDTTRKLIEFIEVQPEKRDVITKNIFMPSLWTAIVITYGRNFTDASKAQKPKLEIKDCFSPDTKHLEETHTYLMDIRHNFIAHRGENDNELSLVYLKLPFEETEVKTSNYRIKSLRSINPSKERLLLCIELFEHLQTIVEEKLQKQTQKVHSRFLKEFTPKEMIAFQIK